MGHNFTNGGAVLVTLPAYIADECRRLIENLLPGKVQLVPIHGDAPLPDLSEIEIALHAFWSENPPISEVVGAMPT